MRATIASVGVGLSLALSPTASTAVPVADDHIHVDQFGYPTASKKVAVISDPVFGFNAGDSFTPGGTYEVRRVADDGVAFSGPVAAWGGGAVHDQSGDRAFSFDFSALEAAGAYYVYDPANDVASHPFVIDDGVYAPVLVDAMRTYFYQRCGTPKGSPHAHPDWLDPVPCHVGDEQDLDCRAVGDPSPATSRNLTGGWHDAGDYNKYVNFADDVVHDLLYAYTETPDAWSDATNVPESGNGVPDILDEVRWELDWFLRMQETDGSVLHKVSSPGFGGESPPSTDTVVRRYAPPTASATVAACGAFAHAAWVFADLADAASQAYATTLENAALAAWNWLEANPGEVPSAYDNAGFTTVPAEDSAYQQFANRVNAAVFLFAATGDAEYRDYVDANAADIHLIQWTFAYEFEALNQDALLTYASLPGATPAIADLVRSTYLTAMDGYLADVDGVVDPYRAHLTDGHYVWGSNSVKARKAQLFTNLTVYGLDPTTLGTQRAGALGYVNYLHGVNPLNLVYLTNMDEVGAESSCTELYHAWFADGTVWDSSITSLYGPAPGFVPGGANPSYSPDGAYSGPPIEPPQNQPIQKSYLDWNADWPENSWEVTENSITYQSAVVRLLSKFSGDAIVSTPPPSSVADLMVVRVRPNPVRRFATFTIDGVGDGPVRADVFDVAGRRVAAMVDDEAAGAGRVVVTFDGASVVPGVYFYRVTASEQAASGRLVVR